MRFSIVVVCLNAGEKLLKTVESIRRQTCQDVEIIVKDGFSTDGSVQALRERYGGLPPDILRIYEEQDAGIYEGMNQALPHCRGEYILFLNCGDSFYDETVLASIAEGIEEQKKQSQFYKNKKPMLFYGDVYEKLTDQRVASNPHIDAFACYRNVPCHQCCFYDRSLFAERGYDTSYRVRADYEHFLWSFFVKKAYMIYLPVTVASYEGGGFSETEANRKRSAQEHRVITAKYMSRRELLKYRLILFATLAPLRTKMAQSKCLSGVYNRLKRLLYN